MRKIFLILGVLAVGGIAHARIIGTNPTGSSSDLWCNGGRIRAATTVSATEVCQDYLGDWIPTTAGSGSGTQTLGTSSFPWYNIYAVSETLSGSSTIGGNATITGNVTTTGLRISGLQKVPQVYVSSTVTPTSSYIMFTSSGSDIVFQSHPILSTSTMTDGTWVTLYSTTSVSVTFTDEGSQTGTAFELGAATRTLSGFKVLTLQLNKQLVPAKWVEQYYGNN